MGNLAKLFTWVNHCPRKMVFLPATDNVKYRLQVFSDKWRSAQLNSHVDFETTVR